MSGKIWISILCSLFFNLPVFAQHHTMDHSSESHGAVEVESQPLLAQALRLQEALSFSGSSLREEDIKQLQELKDKTPGPDVVKLIQNILDPYCINIVKINPEARVKVERGDAKAKLIQGGWTNFLVKVYNDAGVNAQLKVESPDALLPFHAPSLVVKVEKENEVSPGEAANRFLEMQLYRDPPLQSNLSGQGYNMLCFRYTVEMPDSVKWKLVIMLVKAPKISVFAIAAISCSPIHLWLWGMNCGK